MDKKMIYLKLIIYITINTNNKMLDLPNFPVIVVVQTNYDNITAGNPGYGEVIQQSYLGYHN